MLFQLMRLIFAGPLGFRLPEMNEISPLKQKGGKNGKDRTAILVDKHTPTGSNIPQGFCDHMKTDF